MTLYEYELQNAYIGEYVPPQYLCFTANTANSTIKLSYKHQTLSQYVSLEISSNKTNWSSYTIGDTITLTNIGDKVYFRNTSETDTPLNTSISTSVGWYQFEMTGSIEGDGDIGYLLNKNSTKAMSPMCYAQLFYGCTSLTKPPRLTFTEASYYGCQSMFRGCTNLIALPELPATTLGESCYDSMFFQCSKIKLSTTKTGEYQNEYRIPSDGTGTASAYSTSLMFGLTGGSFTGDPSINTTYYTSNTVV